MSFLRRLFQTPPPSWPPPGPIIAWPAAGTAFTAEISGRVSRGYPGKSVDAVGEQHYQDGIDTVAGGRTPDGPRYRDQESFLVPEPDNPMDPMAVRVCVMNPTSRRWVLAGYLSRADARAYRPAIDRFAANGQLLGGEATITGGWDRGPDDRGYYGVVLGLPSPAALAIILDAADGKIPAAAAPDLGRPFSSTSCPYCKTTLDPMPPAQASRKRCPSCGMTIHVVIDSDGVRNLLTEPVAATQKAKAEAKRERQANREMARERARIDELYDPDD